MRVCVWHVCACGRGMGMGFPWGTTTVFPFTTMVVSSLGSVYVCVCMCVCVCVCVYVCVYVCVLALCLLE